MNKHLEPFRQRYLELLLRTEALRFGTFKTKSGRTTPYFFDTGRLDTGSRISEAASCYASLIRSHSRTPDILFGPAYKGIPLAVATAQTLAEETSREVGWLFNRKEAKDHGEGGLWVGRLPAQGDTVFVIEDVLTGGTSIRETLPLLERLQVRPAALVIGVDREELGHGGHLARDEVRSQWNLEVLSLLTITQILEALHNKPFMGKVWIDDTLMTSIRDYRAQWGKPS